MSACFQYIKELSPGFSASIPAHFKINDLLVVKAFVKPRKINAHKGDFGNGGLIAGSKGMMGAAVLCALAFMRSGGGKLTCHLPETGLLVLQIAVPEVMVKIEEGVDHVMSVSAFDRYDVIGIGPGTGSYASYEKLLDTIFSSYNRPLVLDADALNTLSKNKPLLNKVPAGSVLTPHALEFERLFGKTKSELERIDLALIQSAKYHIVIIIKGPFTQIITPEGLVYFNTTGNPGMATGGSGDVLTGIITGLMAQQYSPAEAAILGVYLHGLAGDLAASDLSQEALIASDIIVYLGKAWNILHQ